MNLGGMLHWSCCEPQCDHLHLEKQELSHTHTPLESLNMSREKEAKGGVRERRETPVVQSLFSNFEKAWESFVMRKTTTGSWFFSAFTHEKISTAGFLDADASPCICYTQGFFVWNLMRLCAVAMFYKLLRFWWENSNSDKCWCTVRACLLNWFARLIHCVLFQPPFSVLYVSCWHFNKGT